MASPTEPARIATKGQTLNGYTERNDAPTGKQERICARWKSQRADSNYFNDSKKSDARCDLLFQCFFFLVLSFVFVPENLVNEIFIRSNARSDSIVHSATHVAPVFAASMVAKLVRASDGASRLCSDFERTKTNDSPTNE